MITLKKMTLAAEMVAVLLTSTSALLADVVTVDKAREIAGQFLLREQTNPPRVISSNSASLIAANQAMNLSLGAIHAVKNKTDEVVAYVQDLEPHGFIITSADDGMLPVLGYSLQSTLVLDSSMSNPLIALVVADVSAQKQFSPGTKGERPSLESSAQWGPWLQTTWTQGGTFNIKCPYKDPDNPGPRRPVGCVATAMAQIVNYWRYPKSVAYSDEDYFYISEARCSFEWSDQYGYPTLTDLQNNMGSLQYVGSTDEAAYLSFGAGVKLHMDYGLRGSGASTYSVRDVLNREFGFGSALAFSGPDVWSAHSTEVIADLQNGWPVQIGISNPDGKSGHSVVVDGYQDDNDRFHLNYGWGASSPDAVLEAWYSIPTNMPHYSVVHSVVCGIAKFQGWNQYGANAENTFGSAYPAPDKAAVNQKWRVTCPAEMAFSDILIGTSSQIFAASSTDASSGHPFVYVIDKFGSIVRQIELNSDGNIEFMCQSAEGEIFAAMEDGYIYRVDPATGSAQQIFIEPNGDDINTLKIDKDGWLYAVTFYRVYALDRTGASRWTSPFVVPSENMFLGSRSIPAIDLSRQRIYISYRNTSTRHLFLAALDRSTGQAAQTRDFGIFTTTSVKVPSLGADGTIYLGLPGILYALNPAELLGTPRWTKSLLIGYTPAIGRDGTLYFPYWEQSGGIWYDKLGAFDPADGSMHWSVPFQLDEVEEGIFQPYIAGNGVVLFTIEHNGSPKTYTLHAYRDNGSSAQELWQYNAGVSGGDYAFGPGRTVYAWGKTGLAQTIYALSDGDVGDPDGSGMDFENNSAPSLAANPSPSDGADGLDTASVQLSWTCSDPDGQPLKYDVYICALADGQEAAFVPVACQISSTSYTLHDLKTGTQYLWSVVASDGQAIGEGPVWRFSSNSPTGVDDSRSVSVLPERFQLDQNYPNPFNPITTIDFDLPQAADVTLDVFNLSGQHVATLVSKRLEAGPHTAEWDATGFASGVYMYRLRAGDYSGTRKMVLLK